jgi:hypothetical protein
MSSELLGSAQNVLKGNLGGAWDITNGYQDAYTDLGIARRFGGAAAAYSLRDIGAMNGRVVKVRRDSDDTEEDFSANQVASGALETFVQDGATQKGLTQSTWQNTGGETFSSTSTDGFSYSNSSGTAFIGVTLSETLALNDSVFVSFNASGITHPSSSDQSPQIRLRDAVGGGSGSSPINQVTNGFNSYTLTYNDGTKANGNHIVFSEGDTAGGTVTISDFKVFGVSRNGFVETWYDQSGNGNDATQTTASDQPSIVQNGGICKSNGSPSVFFTGDTRDDELDFTDLTLTDATIFTVVNIDSSADQQIIIGGSATTSTGTMIPMMDNGSSTTQVYKNATVGGAEQGSSQFKNGSQITLADRDDAFDNLAVDSQILFTMVDVDVAAAKVLDGISRTPADASTFHLQGKMNELIIYNSDLSSDRGTIESEIANHYNITLS